MAFHNQHLDDSIVATRESFVSFSFLNVDELNFAVLRPDIHEVVMQDRSDKRTYHRVVLDDSLKEHSLNNVLGVSCYLPNVQ